MDIIVDGDKSVTIKRLNQWLTYDGLLEGLPTTKLNARILDGIMEVAKRAFQSKEVYLINPAQTPLEYEGRYPFGDPAQLPRIVCMAELWYYKAVGQSMINMDYSALTVVWLQDEFAFPINMKIVEQFKSLPWSKIAIDFEY